MLTYIGTRAELLRLMGAIERDYRIASLAVVFLRPGALHVRSTYSGVERAVEALAETFQVKRA